VFGFGNSKYVKLGLWVLGGAVLAVVTPLGGWLRVQLVKLGVVK